MSYTTSYYFEYCSSLLRERICQLRGLEQRHRRKLIGSSEYFSCRRSLIQSICELRRVATIAKQLTMTENRMAHLARRVIIMRNLASSSSIKRRPSSMSVQYDLDSRRRIVRTTFRGAIGHLDPSRYLVRLRSDPAFDPHFSELVNLSACSEIHLSFTDFLMLADIDPFSKQSKRAIVVGNRPEVYGIARMYQQARPDNRRIAIFTTPNEAEAWIKTPPPIVDEQGL